MENDSQGWNLLEKKQALEYRLDLSDVLTYNVW